MNEHPGVAKNFKIKCRFMSVENLNPWNVARIAESTSILVKFTRYTLKQKIQSSFKMTELAALSHQVELDVHN